MASKFTPGTYKLKVKRGLSGLGLFAETEIPKGACIIEYVGRVISDEEQYTSRSKYLFGINSKITIDGQAHSNTARYINHSCRPNAEPEIRNKRVFIMAKRKIKPGEEITYHYGKEYWGERLRPHGCRCEKCNEKKTS